MNRRVSVSDHDEFRKELAGYKEDIEYDTEFGAIANPRAVRSHTEVDRINQILDEIKVETLRSQNYEEGRTY